NESYERSPLSIQLLKAYLKQNRKDLALAFYKDEASKQDKSEIISAAYNLDGITIIFDGDDMRKILIDAYKKRDKLEELRTHFEQKLEEDTTNPAILEILAEIYWETSDYQKAAETYHTLSNIKPIGQWNIRSFYHAAAAFHQNSQFDMSKVVLDQGNTALASINAKQDRHFLGALATICLQNEMYEPALKLTENAVFKTENMKTTLYEILAMNYLSEKRYEDAFEAYQQMAKENDWSFIQIRAETGMNKALTAGKLYEKWIPEQLKQVAENPNDPKPILKLAQCYEATEQTKEAITQYERLAELEPENSQWYAKLGTLYQNLPQGNRQTETAVEVLNPAQSAKSITAYEKAIELEPTSYQLYDLLAKTYLKTAQTSQAEDTYRRALDAPLTKSDHDAAIRAIIGLYADEGQEHKQIAILEEIRQELPKMNNSAVMHELLGDLYKKAGDSDNAELAYAKWMQIRQKELYSLRSVYDYRDFAEKLLDKALYPETALMFAKRAFFDKPFFDNEFPLTLGRASVANGLYDEALRHFKHAFSLITYKYYDWDIFWEDFTETIKIANDKERYIQMLNTLIDSMPSERSNVRAHIYLMIADFYTENETPDYVENYLLKTGFIPETAWITLGPFNNKDNIGYNTEYITENTTQIDLTAKYEGADEQLSWKKFTDAAFNGFINFGKDNDWCVAYAWTTITSPDEREVFFLFCSDDPSKVWLNSTEVFADSIAQTAILDKNTIPVTLKAGVNTILVKVGNEEGTWGFYLRVTDTDGNPYEDLKINKVQSN
ncbi:tetratricopeptide repeat protein, partial [Candidatus Poribacteria bacterium]|nr:tetratricopeptide repeat protein [Candidatus Poribacteria bacterium]